MDYYSRSLAGERLRACYEVAPPRVVQYLEAECRFVLDRMARDARVLELGCGYGRVLERLQRRTRYLAGIDTSPESLTLAREHLGRESPCLLAAMNATALGFRDGSFDLVLCIQNGISAFRVDPGDLVAEALRVTRSRGTVILSSYADGFWPHRLEWFKIQARHGLVGEIDEDATGDGVIVCRDGFKAGRFRPGDFEGLLRKFGIVPRITEVDGSSVCCEVPVP